MNSSSHIIVVGQARTAGLAAYFKLKQEESEELYTDTKFVLFAFAWLLLIWRTVNIRKLAIITTSIQAMLVLAQTIAPSTEILLAVRSLLGLGGAVFPGALLLSVSKLPSNKMATAAAMFVAVSPAEIVVAGPLLSASVRIMKYMSILSWQALFVIDGILGLIVALTLWWKLTASMDNFPPKAFHNPNVSTSWKQKLRAFFDPKELILVAMFICCNLVIAPAPCYLAVRSRISFVSVPYFFFTVISDLEPSHLIFNLLIMAPYLVSIIGIFIVARVSDKKQTRGYFVVACMFLSATGFVIMSLVAVFEWNLWWSFVGIFPACIGTYGAMTIIIAWGLGSEGSDFKQGVLLTMLLGAAQLASIFSPAGVKPWWRAEDEPAHPRGLGVSAALMALGTMMALVLRLYLVWKNPDREQYLYAPVETGGVPGDVVEGEVVYIDRLHRH